MHPARVKTIAAAKRNFAEWDAIDCKAQDEITDPRALNTKASPPDQLGPVETPHLCLRERSIREQVQVLALQARLLHPVLPVPQVHPVLPARVQEPEPV